MFKQFLTSTIQNGHDGLLRTFNAVPDDKLLFKPLDNGRTALDLFSDAAQTAGMVQKLVESRGKTIINREMFGQMAQERASWSKQDALTHMEANHNGMIAAIQGLGDDELGMPITMQLGGGMTMPLAGWIMMSYRTYTSRFAQINYIQTLYGDTESH